MSATRDNFVAMLPVTLDETFRAQVEPLRRELFVHCYRMVGSVHDAEDLVQETYLRAWRSYDRFENRSSVRTWMYRIATNACLTALGSKHRRILPTGIGTQSSDPDGELHQCPELTWLEPLPDRMLWSAATPDPADTILARDSVRLAFVAALQHLTAQQRAVVLLCDVLAWRAHEVADALALSVSAVNSCLQRARARLARLDPETAPRLPEDDERTDMLLARYVAAFEDYDVAGIVELLTEDAIWEMPPFTGWYSGVDTIGRLIATRCPAEEPGDMRLIRTSANAQPAFAVYLRDDDGVHRAFHLQQLTLTDRGVSHVVAHFDTGLFEVFGLPEQLTSIQERELATPGPGRPHCG